MRLYVTLIGLLVFPLTAIAQPAPGGGGQMITRDEFIQRAAQAAGRRFDMIDTNHTGAITRAQLRAFRRAHSPGAPAAAPSQPDPE